MEILRERPSARYLERGRGAGSPAPHPDHVHPGIMAWIISEMQRTAGYEMDIKLSDDSFDHIEGCPECGKIFDEIEKESPRVTRQMIRSGQLFVMYPPRL